MNMAITKITNVL